MNRPTQTLRVYGLPAPQGSKSFKGFSGNGKAYMQESSIHLRPWRDSVIWACREDKKGYRADEPLSVTITFYMPRPKKPKWNRPAVKPDIDKLIRSTLDALKIGGRIEDDCRVVELIASKCFADERNFPLGAAITIREL
jgi:crossover junction endodeoxyribonuclease RusA